MGALVFEVLAFVGGLVVLFWVVRLGVGSALNVHERRKEVSEWYSSLFAARNSAEKSIRELTSEDAAYFNVLPLIDENDFRTIFSLYGKSDGENGRALEMLAILDGLSFEGLDRFSKTLSAMIERLSDNALPRRICGLKVLALTAEIEFLRRHAGTEAQKVQADRLIGEYLKLVCGTVKAPQG